MLVEAWTERNMPENDLNCNAT